MPPSAPQITEWIAYEDSPTTAKVSLLGTGFGDQPGAVTLIEQGGGVLKNVVVRLWTDTVVIAEAPLSAVIKRVFVDVPLTSRAGTVRAHSPAGQNGYTESGAATFTVATVVASIDDIRITGTDLDNVDSVYLQDDSGIPAGMESGAYNMDGADLVVQWPASFPESYVGRIILADTSVAPYAVEQLTAGYEPVAPTPLVSSVLVHRTASGTVTLNILGRSFGAVTGTVDTHRTEGLLASLGWSREKILVNGWSDTAIICSAPTGTTFDEIVVTKDGGEIAAIDPSIVLPITTPSGTPSITSVSQYGATPTDPGTSEPYYFAVHGVNLADIARFTVGTRIELEPLGTGTINGNFSVWNADLMGDWFDDQLNTPAGINVITWDADLIEFSVTGTDYVTDASSVITRWFADNEYLTTEASQLGLMIPIN